MFKNAQKQKFIQPKLRFIPLLFMNFSNIYTMKKWLLFVICLSPTLIFAQDFHLGVRIGLNFNSFLSESEQDADGMDLETFDSSTGFLIGATGEYEINDYFGVRAELLYSQKGGKRKYDGAGRVIFNPETGNAVLAVGERFSTVRVTNNYFDLPLSAYVALGKFRLYGGVNIGILIGSFGSGELRFDGTSANTAEPIAFTSNIDYNYLKDEGFTSTDVSTFENPTMFFADGSEIIIPENLSAYYLEFPEKTDPYFNRLELGLTGSLAYLLNSALYVSFAANLGLNDATTNAYDVSYTSTDGLNRVFRADKDRMLSLQASIGFQF